MVIDEVGMKTMRGYSWGQCPEVRVLFIVLSFPSFTWGRIAGEALLHE